jgi:O-antigen/teichoic acid export membrane protein
MRHTVVLLSALCIVLFAAAGLIERVLFPDYEGMATALRFVLPGVLMYSLAQSYSGYYTWQRGMPWVSAAVAGGALCADIALAVVLIPAMGISGAALASTLAKSMAMIVALGIFVKAEGISFSQVYRFGSADVDDYRSLLGRVRSRLGSSA